MSADGSCYFASQLIGTAYMTAEYGYDILAKAVDAQHGGVAVFVVDQRRNRSDANAQCSDEHEGIVVIPMLTDRATWHNLSMIVPLKLTGNILSRLANLYNGYFIHH